MASLKSSFIEQGAAIRYRCWGREGGFVIAKFDRDAEVWMHRHENDAEWSSERMSVARARALFPTDARTA